MSDRYKNLDEILKCINIDITNEADLLPEAELLIANLLIEYIGYDAFSNALMKVNPQYVSCVIQMNETEKQWVSDSPRENSLTEKLVFIRVSREVR